MIKHFRLFICSGALNWLQNEAKQQENTASERRTKEYRKKIRATFRNHMEGEGGSF